MREYMNEISDITELLREFNDLLYNYDLAGHPLKKTDMEILNKGQTILSDLIVKIIDQEHLHP